MLVHCDAFIATSNKCNSVTSWLSLQTFELCWSFTHAQFFFTALHTWRFLIYLLWSHLSVWSIASILQSVFHISEENCFSKTDCFLSLNSPLKLQHSILVEFKLELWLGHRKTSGGCTLLDLLVWSGASSCFITKILLTRRSRRHCAAGFSGGEQNSYFHQLQLQLVLNTIVYVLHLSI